MKTYKELVDHDLGILHKLERCVYEFKLGLRYKKSIVKSIPQIESDLVTLSHYDFIEILKWTILTNILIDKYLTISDKDIEKIILDRIYEQLDILDDCILNVICNIQEYTNKENTNG